VRRLFALQFLVVHRLHVTQIYNSCYIFSLLEKKYYKRHKLVVISANAVAYLGAGALAMAQSPFESKISLLASLK